MDQVMWVVVGVALLLAVAMSILAVRLLGKDRRRHAARVAALEAAAQYEADAPAEPEPHPALEFDLALDHAAVTHAPVGAMFAATNEPKAPPRRWMALTGVAALMMALVAVGYTLLKPAALDAATAGSPTASVAPVAPVSASTPAAGPPLELLSLRHTADEGAFTVTGLVQNPLNGASHPRVVAIVYLFDQSGAYFANGKAELEFRGLRPGEESPFSIRIPSHVAVTRYRVGFRADDGSVVPHVDRRGQAMAGLMTEGKD